jgi:hypothetical protein
MGAGSGPAMADVGRLFFTPSERAAFEASRRAAEAAPGLDPIEIEPEAIPTVVEDASDELKPTITIDGYVGRSNGRATLWVNGENSYDGDLSASRVVPFSAEVHDGRISVTPMDDDSPVTLKPGQSYDPNSAATTDTYETPALAEETPAL